MIYFTSDLHLYHKNIIEYAHRPFETVEEMNETIIHNINTEVSKNDFLFILGDFCFLSVKKAIDLFKKINCNNITFTQGNHDQKRFVERIVSESGKNINSFYINEEPTFLVDNNIIHFNHIPLDKISQGDINLHGHIHTEGHYSIINKGYYDVGVDNNEFKPISMRKIREINNF